MEFSPFSISAKLGVSRAFFAFVASFCFVCAFAIWKIDTDVSEAFCAFASHRFSLLVHCSDTSSLLEFFFFVALLLSVAAMR